MTTRTKKHHYTPEQKDFLLKNVTGQTANALLVLFNEEFHLSLSVSKLRAFKKNHKLSSGVCSQFCKGCVPINKGKKWEEFMSPEGQAASRKTTLKPGQTPKNHKPVGTESRHYKHGVLECVKLKIAEPNVWVFKHRYAWEQAHGPIPKGHKLLFLDGDRTNARVDNLALVTDAELKLINQNGLYLRHKELTESGIAIARLMQAGYERINKSKNKGDKHEN